MNRSGAVLTLRTRWILLGAIALAAALAAVWMVRARVPKLSPELATPMLALDALSSRSLYFNAPARPWLLARRPDLVADEARDEKSDRSRGMTQAVQNPRLFRQLDRKYRFDTLLLLGDPSQSRPLIEHLLETKDWKLTYLDHTSLVFKREAPRAWHPGDLAAIRAKLPSQREQTSFLAQAAAKLLALQRAEEGKALLDEAGRLDPRVADVWSGLAIYRMNRGEWNMALGHADRALELDPASLSALASKTQILFSTRKFDEAFTHSGRLIERVPDDPGLLFYHAKIAHEAHAYGQEIQALRRLVELAERDARPASGYRIYLAQAYAADGQAQPSVDEFTRALADPDLSKEQRQFAEELLAQIKSRAGL